MSFWPFPKTLREEIQAGAALGPALDLGAGRGEFARQLRRHHVHPILVDHILVLDEERSLRVCCQAERLPFAPMTFGLMTAANHVRHLDEATLAAELRESARCARVGARHVVVEDTPEFRDEAEENYRRVLDLLASVDQSRGGACDRSRVEGAAQESGWTLHSAGEFDNELVVDDPVLPLRWLRTHIGECGRLDEIDELEERIRRHGMTYGRAWYLVLERQAR